MRHCRNSSQTINKNVFRHKNYTQFIFMIEADVKRFSYEISMTAYIQKYRREI